MTREYNSQSFKINDHVTVFCHTEDTRSGFRHLATLFDNGMIRARAKECYINRTWERYDYQTVLRRLSGNVIDPLGAEIKTFADNYQEPRNAMFDSLTAVCALGEIMGMNQTDTNDWKARMLKAGLPQLDIPDDWDTLAEDEKTRRLNTVIGELSK
jgi:hypothetical protein